MTTIGELAYNADTGAIIKDPQQVDIQTVQVPDLWHIAMAQKDPCVKAAILNTWHIAHDAINALKAASTLELTRPDAKPVQTQNICIECGHWYIVLDDLAVCLSCSDK